MIKNCHKPKYSLILNKLSRLALIFFACIQVSTKKTKNPKQLFIAVGKPFFRVLFDNFSSEPIVISPKIVSRVAYRAIVAYRIALWPEELTWFRCYSGP